MCNYIELMRIRYIDDIDISFAFPDMNVCRKVELPPLLLIVLVENAFKHGVSYTEPSYINIDISVAEEKGQRDHTGPDPGHCQINHLANTYAPGRKRIRTKIKRCTKKTKKF